MAELWCAFTSDADDNHPNYVPMWRKCGSNYNKNPADVKWSWTKHWNSLSAVFSSQNVPVTWLLRVDKGPVLNQMLTLFKNTILELESTGDEIGIHIHTFGWNPELSRWVQTQDPQVERRGTLYALNTFKKSLGFTPSSARMGWNTMSNEIMRTLDDNGVKVDASAIPGTSCLGKFHKRDNIYDWSKAPYVPYHPSFEDYQSPGKMKILEMPISGLKTNGTSKFTTIVNKLSSFQSLTKLLPIARRFNLSPHYHFYISPYWSPLVYDRIIEAYCQEAIDKGIAFLVGTFHACDIINPTTSEKNWLFEDQLRRTIEKIESLTKVEVTFTTLSKLAYKYDSMNQ